MRVPGKGRALRPPTLGWLLRVWIELEELLCDFSLKPFVGPSPTPQSHHGWCSSLEFFAQRTEADLRGPIFTVSEPDGVKRADGSVHPTNKKERPEK